MQDNSLLKDIEIQPSSDVSFNKTGWYNYFFYFLLWELIITKRKILICCCIYMHVPEDKILFRKHTNCLQENSLIYFTDSFYPTKYTS